MATKNTLNCLWVVWAVALIPLLSHARTEEEEFKFRRDYMKSRYEDFFLHYDFIDHYEASKDRSGLDVKASRSKEERDKDQARKDYLKTRRLPGPYNTIEDGSGNKEDQKEQKQARREFLEHRESLRRLEQTGPQIPPAIESGLEDPTAR